MTRMSGTAATLRRRRWPNLSQAGTRYRLGVAARVLAAIFGGYAVAALSATVLALYLPMLRIEAAVTATLASFGVYTGAVMWVFAARSAARAWLGLVWLALPLAVLWWFGRL